MIGCHATASHERARSTLCKHASRMNGCCAARADIESLNGERACGVRRSTNSSENGTSLGGVVGSGWQAAGTADGAMAAVAAAAAL
jgi:hypothetical protein